METNVSEAVSCLTYLTNQEEIQKRGICIEDSIPENSILFLGINPAFSKEDEKTPKTYSLNEIKINDRFFGEAKKMALEVNKLDHSVSFGHHDLFPIRETNQKIIKDMFIANGKELYAKEDCRKFIDASLRWSEKTISSAKPKIIVVLNAFASQLFFEYILDDRHLLNFKPNNGDLWNPKLCCDFVRLAGQIVPIMFSGMLTGQHALDKYSRFRLQWHILHILSHQNLWPK